MNNHQTRGLTSCAIGAYEMLRVPAVQWRIPSPRDLNVIPQRRSRSAFPFMLLAVGIGLTGYYGVKWFELPTYSESDIAASTELNMQLELQAQHAQTTPESRERLRKQTRQDLLNDIAKERRDVETGLGAGLIALVLSIGNIVLMTLLQRERARH